MEWKNVSYPSSENERGLFREQGRMEGRVVRKKALNYFRASAPPTISMSSLVIAACLVLL